jgi:hypothetical protein
MDIMPQYFLIAFLYLRSEHPWPTPLDFLLKFLEI